MKSTDPNARSPDTVQGEGDYQAARRYDKAQRDFAQSGKVDKAAHDAHPADAKEAEEMRRAEREGRSHAKGEDPALELPEKMPGK
jgi:hypothetical protein